MDISCESQGVRYCVICDYEAEDMYDLEAHHWSEHEEIEVVNHDRRSLDIEDKESDKCVSLQNDNHHACKFCGEKLMTKSRPSKI